MNLVEPQMNADERRSEKERTALSAFIRVHLRLIILLALAGCSANQGKHPSTQPSDAYDRQQAALRDPFGYRPEMDHPEDISGGSLGNYDKAGMKRDIDHVLNP